MAGLEALHVAIVQHESIDCRAIDEVAKNVEYTLGWIDKVCAAYPETNLIVFPEGGIQGGHPKPDPETLLSVDHHYILSILSKCKEKNVWGVFNFVEGTVDQTFNTTILVNDQGEVKLKYHKVNPFAPLERNSPGKELMVCEGPKGAVFGLMTCYDGDFPEVGRELALLGANVLIRPSSYMEPYSSQWQFVNRARAYENMAYVIACNRTGTSDVFSWFGSSEIIDFDGLIITKLPSAGEFMTTATIYPFLVDDIRKNRKIGNHLYNLFHRGNTVDDNIGIKENPYQKTESLWQNK